MPPSLLRIVSRCILGLWLAWAATAFAIESREKLSSWNRRDLNALPCRWHFGNSAVQRLQRCLSGVEGLLPRNTRVLFESPDGTCAARFFRWRWAAYLLPDLNVVGADTTGGEAATWAIGYHAMPTAPPGTSLEFNRQLDGCRLFRVVRP